MVLGFILPHIPLNLCLDFFYLSVLRDKENSRPSEATGLEPTKLGVGPVLPLQMSVEFSTFGEVQEWPGDQYNNLSLENPCLWTWSLSCQARIREFPCSNHREVFWSSPPVKSVPCKKEPTFVQTLRVVGSVQANQLPCYPSHLHTLHSLGECYFVLPSFPNETSYFSSKTYLSARYTTIQKIN